MTRFHSASRRRFLQGLAAGSIAGPSLATAVRRAAAKLRMSRSAPFLSPGPPGSPKNVNSSSQGLNKRRQMRTHSG